MSTIFLTFLLGVSATMSASAQTHKDVILELVTSGEIERAHDLFLEIGPSYINEGRSYIGMETYIGKWYDTDIAKVAYDKNPDDWRVIIHYATSLLQLNTDESKRLFYKAIEKGLKPVECIPQPYMFGYLCIDKYYDEYSKRYKSITESANEVEAYLRKNLALFPNSMVLQYEIAKFLYEKGEYQEALKYASNVSKNSENNYYGQYLYLSYLYEQGETEILFAELPRILEIKGEQFHRYNGGPLANFVLFSLENENTEPLLLKLTETFPTNPYVQMIYGIYLEYKGRLHTAETYYKKSIPLMITPEDFTAKFIDNYKFAIGADITSKLRKIYVGKSRKAIDKYVKEMIGSVIYNPYELVPLHNYFENLSADEITELYEQEKNKADVGPILFYEFGEYYSTRDYERALEIYNEGISKFPEEDYMYMIYLNALNGVYEYVLSESQKNKLNINIEEIQKYRFINFPRSSDDFQFIKRSKFKDEQMEALHRERISVNQNNYYAHYFFAKHLLKENGREEEAREVLEVAEQILQNHLNENPDDPEMRENLAYQLLEKGEIVEAIEQFRLLSLIEQENPEEQTNWKGVYAEKLVLLKEWDKMMDAYLEHLISWDDNKEAWEDYYYDNNEYKVVDALIVNNEISGVEQRLIDIVTEHPTLSHPYAAYGVYLLKKGIPQEAKFMFEKGYDDKYQLLDYLRTKYFRHLETGNMENVETIKSIINKIIELD